MLLSIKLRLKGWKTVYLNERLSMGLAPEGLQEYITQRGRWCLGFMQIFRSPWGPFADNNLSIIDRISMFDAFLYWSFTFPFRIICLMTPVVYALTGAVIISTTTDGIFIYALPTLLAQLIVLPWVSRGRCLPILSDASQLLIATTAIKATCIGLFGSRDQKFKVTAKGGDRSRTVVQWGLMQPFLIMIALTVAALTYYAFWSGEYAMTEGWNVAWVFWTYYSLLVLIVACITCVELPRSPEERFATTETAEMRRGDTTSVARLLELWPTGAQLRDEQGLVAGERVSLDIEGIGPVAGSVAKAGQGSAEILFDPMPGMRDQMLLKLFSGRYQSAPDETSYIDLFRGLSARLLT